MKRGLLTVLAFLAGCVAGWAASMAAYVALTSSGMLFDRDGGLAMGFAFTIGPLVGVLAGIAIAVLVARRVG